MLQSYMKYTFKVLMKKVFAFAYKKSRSISTPAIFLFHSTNPYMLYCETFATTATATSIWIFKIKAFTI